MPAAERARLPLPPRAPAALLRSWGWCARHPLADHSSRSRSARRAGAGIASSTRAELGAVRAHAGRPDPPSSRPRARKSSSAKRRGRQRATLVAATFAALAMPVTVCTLGQRMETTFEADIRATLERITQRLAREIVAAILGQFGLRSGAGIALAPPPRATERSPRTVKARSTTTPTSKRARSSASGRSPRVYHDAIAAREKLAGVINASSGMSLSEIAKAAGMKRPTLQYSLRSLRQEKRVFMAGDRGYARYAGSVEVAKKAHDAARAKGLR